MWKYYKGITENDQILELGEEDASDFELEQKRENRLYTLKQYFSILM